MLGMMLAAAAHCADPGYCPTAAQLQRAYEDRVRDEILELTAEASAENPDGIVFLEPMRVFRVSGVRCAPPTRPAVGPPTVSCTATFRYYHAIKQRTVTLARDDKGWVVQGPVELRP